MELVERPSWETLCMDIARSISRRSTCQRLQVGCVIATADYSSILSWGYNGGAKGQKNDCESLEPGQCGHVHAEVNAAIKAPYNVPKVVFVTTMPCLVCAKVLVNLGGVEHLYFAELYRKTESLEVMIFGGMRPARILPSGRIVDPSKEPNAALTVDEYMRRLVNDAG